MNIQNNLEKKFQNQIEIFYESLLNSLDHKIQNAVQNLILFGYTDTVDILNRTSSYFTRHCRMNPDEGTVNLSVDFDWDLNGEFIGSTTAIHEAVIYPKKGKNKLIVSDENGNIIASSFTVN